MRIHSDILTAQNIYQATQATGMTGVDADVSTHGSRSRERAFNVLLTGNSTRRPNTGKAGAGGDDFAATWDEWGIFLNALYEIDPHLSTPYYADAYDFHRQTNDRFVDLAHADQCRTHNWQYILNQGHTCKKCNARQVR